MESWDGWVEHILWTTGVGRRGSRGSQGHEGPPLGHRVPRVGRKDFPGVTGTGGTCQGPQNAPLGEQVRAPRDQGAP